MIKLIAQILTIGSFGLTGMYFVAGKAMENVVLKFETRQHKRSDTQNVNYKMYNDSLESERKIWYASENQKLINSNKDLKDFVISENKKQEEQFEVAYMLDDNDSTYKLLTYKGSDNRTIIIRKILISNREFERINN